MATIKAFIRTSKKTTTVNIRFRLSDGRSVQLFHKSEIEIASSDWDEKKETVKAKVIYDTQARAFINRSVSERKDLIQTIYNTVLEKDSLTSDWLETEIDKHIHPDRYAVPEQTIFNLFDEFVSKRKISDVRKNNFRVVGRALKRFELYMSLSKEERFTLTFDAITPNLLRELELFFKQEYLLFESYPELYEAFPETRTPQQRGQNTINGLFTKIRTFVLWALDKGYATTNPFKDFNIEKCVYGTPYYITIDERNQLYKIDLSHRPQLAVQRDVFVFQCLVGCRLGDLYKMTKDNVINGAIEYIARKTKEGRPVTVRVPLNDIAAEILKRYETISENKLLPFISEQKYNMAIKDAFALAGLTRMVTVLDTTTGEPDIKPLNIIASSHLARRTFVGNLYKKVKDQNLVASLSGHQEGSKAFARYREIDEEMKKDLIKLLD